MKDSYENSGSITGDTPGSILKAARTERGLTVVDVAARLCLSVQLIEDMERDDYSHMRARVYARGHLVSYAHLLGIPEQQIQTALSNVKMEFVPEKSLLLDDKDRHIPIQSVETSQQRPSLLIWGSILVLIIILGLAMMWWKGMNAPATKVENPAKTENETTVIIQQPQPSKPAAPVSPMAPQPTPPAPNTSVNAAPDVNQAQPQQTIQPQPTNPPAQPQSQSQPQPQAQVQVQEQSVIQPSDMSNSGNGRSRGDANVSLPPPRASNSGMEE